MASSDNTKYLVTSLVKQLLVHMRISRRQAKIWKLEEHGEAKLDRPTLTPRDLISKSPSRELHHKKAVSGEKTERGRRAS